MEWTDDNRVGGKTVRIRVSGKPVKGRASSKRGSNSNSNSDDNDPKKSTLLAGFAMFFLICFVTTLHCFDGEGAGLLAVLIGCSAGLSVLYFKHNR